MKGPTLGLRSDVMSELDEKRLEPEEKLSIHPKEQITAFKDEILAAAPLENSEQLEGEATLAVVLPDAEVAALYLARFWRKRNPWWADEALQVVFHAGLPVTKAAKVAHSEAMEIRKKKSAQQQGQLLRRFDEQKLKDIAFYQIESMRRAGISLAKASETIALWLEWISKGTKEDRAALRLGMMPKRMWKATTLERESPRWRDDWLRGRIWAEAIRRSFTSMDEANLYGNQEKLLNRLKTLGPDEGHFRGAPR